MFLSVFFRGNKMIQTEIWEANPEKPSYVSFKGCRLVKEVYQEVEKAVRDRFEHDENIGFEYIATDFDLKTKDARWPEGHIIVYSMPGGSEAHRVYVSIHNKEGKYQDVLSCKVWSEKGAHEVCKFIQRLFYFEGNTEIAA